MSEQESRVRTPTEEGLALYASNKERYDTKINSIWCRLLTYIKDIEACQIDAAALQTLQTDVNYLFEDYKINALEFLEFLDRPNTQQSVKDKESFSTAFENNVRTIEENLQRIKVLLCKFSECNKGEQTLLETLSQQSSRSSLSCIIAQNKAKAEEARVRAVYAKKEAEIKRQKAAMKERIAIQNAAIEKENAELEADLEVLAHTREIAATEAALETLEIEEEKSKNLLDIPSVPKKELTAKYVNDLPAENHLNPHAESYFPSQHVTIGQPATMTYHPVQAGYPHSIVQQPLPFQNEITRPLYNTTYQDQVKATVDQNRGLATDFTKFLLKKDLLLSRLCSFSDKTEMYPSWKSTFKNVQEIGATPTEEIDMLVKYTGGTSQKYVLSLHTAHTRNPALGLMRIWERLDERYGSPEMIDSALKNKLASFPKLSNKDMQKLYDLADILSEIEALKEEGMYGSMFSYFDTSIGIGPIVCKLPYMLQEKWTNTASQYNKRHHTLHPPFVVFCDFVREQSKIRNNPSLQYESATANSVAQRQKPPEKPGFKVTTRKTDLQVSNSPGTVCPMHNTGHSLNKCRSFRTKPMAVRKRFLKDKGICYKCCAGFHLAAKCSTVISCEICNGKNHPTALHAVSEHNRGQTSHGGEQADRTFENDTRQSTEVKPYCTQICGNTFTGKSCAKTVLVRMYSQSMPSKKTSCYAMIDDQSNQSLATPSICDFFRENCTQESMYLLSTCSGQTRRTGRKLRNVNIESIDGSRSFHLPPVLECDQIPDVRNEIPTPDVASHYPHFAI